MDARRVIGIILLITAIIFGARQLVQPPGSVGLPDPYFVVYFSSETDGRLLPEYRHGYGTIEERARALESGPTTKGLVNMLPRGTEILGMERQDGVLVMDFNEKLRARHPGGSYGELLTVYGIVNSMVEASRVDAVQIKIEGEVLDSLAGHVYLREPLGRDSSLVGRNPPAGGP